MNKLFLFISLSFIVSSCSVQENDDFNFESSNYSTYHKSRTVDDAITIAVEAMSTNNGRSYYGINKENVYVFTSDNHSRSTLDSLVYAVNFDNGEGYVLVSVPSNVSPVLAVVEQGDINNELALADETTQFIISQATNYVKREMSANGIIGVDPILQPYDKTVFVNIKKGPNLETCWGLDWPANLYSPNKIAGCAPLAITEILSYFEMPTTIVYSFEGCPINNETLNWKSIKSHIYFPYLSPSQSEMDTHLNTCDADIATHQMIGRLVREMGNRSNADYYDHGTGVYDNDACNALKNTLGNKFLYVEITNIRDLTDRFEKNKGEGIAYVSLNSPAHALIADGAWLKGERIYHYVIDDLKNGTYKLGSITDNVVRYLHFNWGLNGKSNGFFLEGVFDLTKGQEYDHPEYGIQYDGYNGAFYSLWIEKHDVPWAN